jgi:hypothetical protein
MQRDETGFLLLQTQEEKDAVRLVLGMPGWRIIEAAHQNQIQTAREDLSSASLMEGSFSDVECGRKIGYLQGSTAQFALVLGKLMEQLQEETPDLEAGKDTTEGDSLGLVPPDPAELKGFKEHGTDEPEF